MKLATSQTTPVPDRLQEADAMPSSVLRTGGLQRQAADWQFVEPTYQTRRERPGHPLSGCLRLPAEAATTAVALIPVESTRP